MDSLVRATTCPEGAVVHQFRRGSVRKRKRVKQREDVAVTLNFDGIGGRAAKVAGYERLTATPCSPGSRSSTGSTTA